MCFLDVLQNVGGKARRKGKKPWNVNHKNLHTSDEAVWQRGARATLYIKFPSVAFLTIFLCQISAIQGQQSFKSALTTRKLICAGS